MKTIEIKKTGNPEVLEIKDVKLDEPKSEEVLIKQTAIGLNYIDTYHRSGLYPVPLPSGIGLEGAGIICLLYTSPSPRDLSTSRMPSSA